MGSIHELLKQVYPLKLRMELFNAIWTNWREDVKEKDHRIAELEAKLAEKEKEIANQRLKQAQNKKAIEELEGLQVQCQFDITFADYEQEQRLYDYINDRIKELKGVDVNA